MSLFKSAFTVGSLTLCSRLLGYTRDILIASILGAGGLADAFFVAFRLPNFFRQLSAEGAFNNAFVPLFSGKLNAHGKKKAVAFAEHVLSFMLVVLLVVTVVMEIFMPAVMHVLAPGFVDDAEQFATVVTFGRIVFPYLLFISLAALFGGMLNSLGKFAAFAAAPILLNICTITTLLFLVRFAQTPAHALSWAVAFAGVAQLVWMLVAAKRHGVFLKLGLPRLDSEVRTLLRRMVPGIIGGGVTQINLWVNTLIATLLPGAVSYLYYADRLAQFPLAIIGTAMGTALLPSLSRSIREKNNHQAIATQNKALELVLLLTLPAAAGLIVLAQPLIAVMFERGQFGAMETAATAQALIAYGVGLPAFVMIKIFAPGFFANGDTKTPVQIAAVCLVINVVLSLTLISSLGHVGLAIATSVSSWVNALLLSLVLSRRGLYKVDKRLLTHVPRIILAAALMVLLLLVLKFYFSDYFAATLWIKATALMAFIISGMAAFFIALRLVSGYTAGDIKKLLN